MERFFRGSFIGSLFLLMGVFGMQAGGLKSNFKNPPMKFRPQPLYFWNDTVKAVVVAQQMKQLRDHDGYGGLSILGFGKKFYPEYLSDAYFERFHASFGKTLVRSFFDEPTMYRAKGRIWTGKFNDEFRQRFGYYPYLLYPALWYNVGPDTEAERNLLFGLRTELYALGFTKVVSDWSVGHMLQATGHQDQEEVVNPVGVSGDLMKVFQYLDIPGIDKIGGNRPAERFYKIVSSASYNWDKPYVMSETYGAMGNISLDTMYTIAMDQYAKGVNMLLPHAVWYNDKNVAFKPELSYRNPLYSEGLPAFNKYLSRLNVVLQAPARHVADVAVLYPINTLQGEHRFDGPLKSTFGGILIPRTDYVNVSNLLIDSLGIDFTFLHPEVFSSNCTSENGLLKLNNKLNWETWQVLVLPSMKTITTSNIVDAKSFYEAGGKVVFTTRLPWKAMQLNGDSIVQSAIRGIFPELAKLAPGDSFPEISMEVSNAAGGKAYFIPNPTAANLRAVLSNALVPDVAFESGKPLEYIHKVRDGKDLYFFANNRLKPYAGVVALKGEHHLKWMDPHTGKSVKALTSSIMRQNQAYTLVDLKLEANRSVFLVAK